MKPTVYGVLSFKGTVKEFKVFLQSLTAEGISSIKEVA